MDTNASQEWFRLTRASVPDEQQDAAWSVEANLNSLGIYKRKFRGALTLFDFVSQQITLRRLREKYDAESSQLFGEWLRIAGRDGAMTIYHYGVALVAVRQTLGLCPSISGVIDHSLLRGAIRDFRKFFPVYERMRHAIAHTADRTKSPNKLKEHGLQGDHEMPGLSIASAKNTTIMEAFGGKTFGMSWEGEMLTYDLSDESLEKLDKIRAAVWSLFPSESSTPGAPRPLGRIPHQ